MRIILFLLLIPTSLFSQKIEIDDLYYNKTDREKDTLIVKNIRKYIKSDWSNYDMTYPFTPYFYRRGFYNYYPYEYYRNRTIVIVPKKEDNFIYQKRPSRDGYKYQNNTPRRGRN